MKLSTNNKLLIFLLFLLFTSVENVHSYQEKPSSAVPPVVTNMDNNGDYYSDVAFPQWVREEAPVSFKPGLSKCRAGAELIPAWADPLPVKNIVCAALSPDLGEIWAATAAGVIFIDTVNYRILYFAGKRWLPDDNVQDIYVSSEGNAIVKTAGGFSVIARKMITLNEKAMYFEEITQKRHNRDGMISGSGLRIPGDVSTFFLTDDDNDGQWTEMYLAAESFRYAATKDRRALKNARNAFQAMVRLLTISPVKGYPARSILSVDKCPGRDPERWRKHASGVLCWKSDTSVDELVGHYFGLPIYYDLVANEKEKELIRTLINDMTSHLVDNGLRLVDENGNVTTHGHLDPEWVNTAGVTGDQGLNSLDALSALRSAWHITGEKKYYDLYYNLIKNHGYHRNVLKQKEISDRYQVNHDSDEMAFLSFYNLIRYEDDPVLRDNYFLEGLRRSWKKDLPERNPEQIIIYGAFARSEFKLDLAVRTLQEIPLDLVEWKVTNSARTDIEKSIRPGIFGELQSIHVLPYTEVRTMRWSLDMYALDTNDNGTGEQCPTFWLLPYWMAVYYGMIR